MSNVDEKDLTYADSGIDFSDIGCDHQDNTAYNTVLALESIPDSITKKWNFGKKVYNGVTNEDLEKFVRTVAYKVAHNLSNGFEMDKDNNPLTYVDCDFDNINNQQKTEVTKI